MNQQQAIKILTEFNRYRRGEHETFKDFEIVTGVGVTEIGIAIDYAVEQLEQINDIGTPAVPVGIDTPVIIVNVNSDSADRSQL